ncbi:MAG: hypothetical protein JST21_13700 [Bacteroidetes bacterium]|nr:hypothetical protein [Bacteroidota bacterium]
MKISTKNRFKTGGRDITRAAMIKKTAEITGVSQRHVQRMVNGYQKITDRNEQVFAVFMDLTEGTNSLIESVKKVAPFKKPKKL